MFTNVPPPIKTWSQCCEYIADRTVAGEFYDVDLNQEPDRLSQSSLNKLASLMRRDIIPLQSYGATCDKEEQTRSMISAIVPGDIAQTLLNDVQGMAGLYYVWFDADHDVQKNLQETTLDISIVVSENGGKNVDSITFTDDRLADELEGSIETLQKLVTENNMEDFLYDLATRELGLLVVVQRDYCEQKDVIELLLRILNDNNNTMAKRYFKDPTSGRNIVIGGPTWRRQYQYQTMS